jgi:hypothetical protein
MTFIATALMIVVTLGVYHKLTSNRYNPVTAVEI